MRRIVNAVLLLAMVVFVPTAASWAASPYSQDFEGLVQADPDALANDGWLVFANVYDGGGVYQYGYGPFPAPNGGPGFCGIAVGEGGASQGAQQLVVYSDYNNGDHANGFLIESNVFQEQTIESGDVGQTVVFTIDAKLGDLVAPSEAEAFIKTLDPNNGYATTNHITTDMTAIPTTWNTYTIQLPIDSGLVGQILQFGFTTKASLYAPSGVFYDNVNTQISVQPTPTPDPNAGGNPIPTMNLWGVLAMVLMLIGVAMLVIIRRQ